MASGLCGLRGNLKNGLSYLFCRRLPACMKVGTDLRQHHYFITLYVQSFHVFRKEILAQNHQEKQRGNMGLHAYPAE